MKVSINPYYGCDISTLNDTLDIYPGQGKNIYFYIENLANTPDNIIISSSLITDLETEIFPSVFEMEPFSSGKGMINIKAGEDALAGTYHLNLSGRTGFGPEDINSTDWCLIRVNIIPVFNLTISPPTIEKEAEPGELSCSFWISNRGNSPDVALVEYSGSPAKWLRSPTRNLTIEPGGDSSITLNLSIPKDAKAGDYSLEIRVISGNGRDVFAKAVLNITVKGDDNENIMGALSVQKKTLIGGIVLVAIIALIVVIIVTVKRRSKRTKTPAPGPKAGEFSLEPPPPTYEELYSNLPKISKSGSEYEPLYESEGQFTEYTPEETLHIATDDKPDLSDTRAQEEYYEETYPDYISMGKTPSEEAFYGPMMQDSKLMSWDDDIETEFREMKMPSVSGRKRKRKGKTASKKIKQDIEGMIKPIYRTDIIDALFEFDEEPAEVSVADWDAGDDEEKEIDISDDSEDEGVSGLEWED